MFSNVFTKESVSISFAGGLRGSWLVVMLLCILNWRSKKLKCLGNSVGCVDPGAVVCRLRLYWPLHLGVGSYHVVFGAY
jgi:hypothetical protein